jgi:hypothetical protein
MLTFSADMKITQAILILANHIDTVVDACDAKMPLKKGQQQDAMSIPSSVNVSELVPEPYDFVIKTLLEKDFPTTAEWAQKVIRRARRQKVGKPHIDDIYNAFHQYHFDSTKIGREVGVRNPKAWQEAMDVARAELKRKLTEMDIAEAIDWLQPDGTISSTK